MSAAVCPKKAEEGLLLQQLIQTKQVSYLPLLRPGDFNRFAETLCARPADTGPVLDDHGSSGAHLWVCRTVVLDKRAAAAAISAESWSFDQLRQVCALWRQPHSDWSGGFSAHSRPCSEGLSYGDNDSCRRAPEFVLDKLSVAESWWSGPEDEFFQLLTACLVVTLLI